MEMPQKTKNRTTTFDPAIPLPGIFPEKTMTQRDTCTLMFIVALFAIAKTWKQSKYPSTEEWIKMMWYIYTMEYYSAIKRNQIPAFLATWMDLETIMLSEVRDQTHILVDTSQICFCYAIMGTPRSYFEAFFFSFFFFKDSVAHLLNPFIHLWIFRLFPCLGYCE